MRNGSYAARLARSAAPRIGRSLRRIDWEFLPVYWFVILDQCKAVAAKRKGHFQARAAADDQHTLEGETLPSVC